MCSCRRVFQGISSVLQSKKFLNCIKYLDTAVDCVDTTMFPLQATVFFSKNRAVFNGSVFARGVWSCFPMLDHEERWRASINSSSYQWALGRSNQGGFVPLCVSLHRRYHFPLCGSLLCRRHLPYSVPLSFWFWHAVMLFVVMFRAVKITAALVEQTPVSQSQQLLTLSICTASICVVMLAGTPCNKRSLVLSRQPHNFPTKQENLRRGGVQGLATG